MRAFLVILLTSFSCSYSPPKKATHCFTKQGTHVEGDAAICQELEPIINMTVADFKDALGMDCDPKGLNIKWKDSPMFGGMALGYWEESENAVYVWRPGIHGTWRSVLRHELGHFCAAQNEIDINIQHCVFWASGFDRKYSFDPRCSDLQ